ncbi:MAG: hypothetical protein QME57_03585 [Patescibacteria group bacterium]|nr:hypothetical protein [Patescibacteria group bacterium]
MGNIVYLKGSVSAKSSATAKPSVFTRYSIQHKRCAILFSKECEEIEKKYIEGSPAGEEFISDQAYAIGAVVTSVAYLEATINEFFIMAGMDSFRKESFNAIPDETIQKLLTKWGKGDWKKGEKGNDSEITSKILYKYMAAFRIIKDTGMDINEDLYDLQHLIDLRNELIHYKPQWQPSEDPQNSYKAEKLKGKFPENVFMKSTGDAFFPKKCLGAGCAAWSIRRSEEFIRHFYSSVGVSIYDFSDLGRTKMTEPSEYCITPKLENILD